MAGPRKSNGRTVSRVKTVSKRPKTDRSRISRACDFCKIKKRKCDGSERCENCRTNGATCTYETKRSRDVKHQLFRMRYLLDEAVQILYQACLARKGFPGTTLSEHDGKVSTLSILEHLGIMNSSVEDLDYERYLSASKATRQNTSPSTKPSTASELVAFPPDCPKMDHSDHTSLNSTATSPASATFPTPSQSPPCNRSSKATSSISTSAASTWNSRARLDPAYRVRSLSPFMYTEHGSPMPSTPKRNELPQLSSDYSAPSPTRTNTSRRNTDATNLRVLEVMSDPKSGSRLDETAQISSEHHARRQQTPISPLSYQNSAASPAISHFSPAIFYPSPPHQPTVGREYTPRPSHWQPFFDGQAYRSPQFDNNMTMNQLRWLQQQAPYQSNVLPPSQDPAQLHFEYADARCRERG